MDVPASPTGLEAPNFWILKTDISGHRPPKEPLNRALGQVQPGQDQEEQVLKERRANNSGSRGKEVK